MSIVNKVGSVVEGDNFFGRKRELERAWELIENGNSLILAAPRRIGKSSFAKKMIEIAKSKSWNAVYIDLEKSRSESDFITQFVYKLKGERWYKKAGTVLDNINVQVSVSGIGTSLEWKNRKQDIYRKLEKTLVHEKNTLIVIDELTVFLNNLQKGTDKEDFEDVVFFLNWLRGLRQDTTDTKIRWIFCSSISIESFANKHNLSYSINDVTRFPIDELKGDEPALFVQALAESEKLVFTDELIRYLLNKLNWNLPYFIQALFKEIVDLIKLSGYELSSKTINKAYQALIDTPYFNTWEERLKDYLDDEDHARIILKELSKIKAGKNRNSLHTLVYSRVKDAEGTDILLSRLLQRLKNDGYIMLRNGKYIFRSPLLRDFWNNRFVR
jgi:Cdc6-like AAA superfamily ATPase